ncbi:MAG TPA: hypothetical protein VK536_01720 [Candidatus Limnocylindrales bacterium]|nr:hypothetical protein [Candidatus Limnocylindrales bacterium]
MKKENENIHLFIIEQEYERNRAKQNDAEGFSGKAETPILSKQNNASVIRKLKDTHSNFAAIEEPESLQATDEPEQVDGPQAEASRDPPDFVNLLASLRKMRTEEQQLLEVKRDLLATERRLHSKLIAEIDEKKEAIDELRSEILASENICKQIGQVFGVDM